MSRSAFAQRLFSAIPGEVIEVQCPWRDAPVLTGNSIGARLVRGIFSGGLSAADASAIRATLLDATKLNAGALFGDTLTVRTGDLLHTIDVNMANTQFVAADTQCIAFRWGYEPDTLALIDLLVDDDGHFIDAGANFGYFSLFLATRPGFSGRITAFEPAPAPFADLAGIVQASGLAGVIDIRQIALSNRSGAAQLTEEVWSGSARIDEAARGPAITLARLDALDLPAASLIKADVEFHEAELFEGGGDYIRIHKPSIVFEMHKTDDLAAYRAPIDILEAMGYRFALMSYRLDQSAPEAAPDSITLTVTVGVADTPAERPEYYNILAFHPEGALPA